MSDDSRVIVEGLVLELALGCLAGAILWSDTDALFWVWFLVSVPAPAWVAIRTPGSMSRFSPGQYVGLGLFLAVPVLVGMVIALMFIGIVLRPCEPPEPICMPPPYEHICDDFGDGGGMNLNICGPGVAFLGGFTVFFTVLPVFPLTTTVVGVTRDLLTGD